MNEAKFCEYENPNMNGHELEAIKPGQDVIINDDQDMWMDYDARPFIGKHCKVIKRTKAGLVQVCLESNPKEVFSFTPKNVDILRAQ